MQPQIRAPIGDARLAEWNRNIERAIGEATSNGDAASVSGAFTVTAVDGAAVFLIHVSGLRVTLPSPVGNRARLTFKLMVPGAFSLVSSDGIDGAGEALLSMQYEAVTLCPGGDEWVVLMAYQPQAEVLSALTTQNETSAELLAALKALLFLTAETAPGVTEDPDRLIAEFSA